MDEKPNKRASPKADGAGASGGRQARLAGALKANLARRKAQARRRALPRPAAPEERGS
jgi:hypothetical protein